MGEWSKPSPDQTYLREASFGPNLMKPVAGYRQKSSPAASTVAVLAGVVVAVVVSLVWMT